MGEGHLSAEFGDTQVKSQNKWYTQVTKSNTQVKSQNKWYTQVTQVKSPNNSKLNSQTQKVKKYRWDTFNFTEAIIWNIALEYQMWLNARMAGMPLDVFCVVHRISIFLEKICLLIVQHTFQIWHKRMNGLNILLVLLVQLFYETNAKVSKWHF